MLGHKGLQSDRWHEGNDYIGQLAFEIDDALASLDEECRSTGDHEGDLFLKALMQYIIAKYEVDAVDYVLKYSRTQLDRKREFG